MGGEIASQGDFAQVIFPAVGGDHPCTNTLRIRCRPTEPNAEVVVRGFVHPQRRGVVVVHVQQQDVGVAVVVEIGANNATALLGVGEAEFPRPFREDPGTVGDESPR